VVLHISSKNPTELPDRDVRLSPASLVAALSVKKHKSKSNVELTAVITPTLPVLLANRQALNCFRRMVSNKS
jgi:hypothetical protein